MIPKQEVAHKLKWQCDWWLSSQGKGCLQHLRGERWGRRSLVRLAGSGEPSIPSSPVRWSTPLRGVALGFCPSTKWTACNIKRCKTSPGWTAPRKAHWQLTHQLPGEINSFRTRFLLSDIILFFCFVHNDSLFYDYALPLQRRRPLIASLMIQNLCPAGEIQPKFHDGLTWL